ncbi:helix-turn-helix domain-containing protein [Schlesneria sp. T3-172]|uniref:helix-turn-helix domain-containing protein n=1 Tax=Schlesneria sphaerica TaxID=3373610 RepID=UPI0037C9BEC0
MGQVLKASDVGAIRTGFVLGNFFAVTKGTDLEILANATSRFTPLRIGIDRLPSIMATAALEPHISQRIQSTIDSIRDELDHATELIEFAGLERFFNTILNHLLALWNDLKCSGTEPFKTYFSLGVTLGYSQFEPFPQTTNPDPTERELIQASLRSSQWRFMAPHDLEAHLDATGFSLETFLPADQVNLVRENGIEGILERYSLWAVIETRITQLFLSIDDTHHRAGNQASVKRIAGIEFGTDFSVPVVRTVGGRRMQVDLTEAEFKLLKLFFDADDHKVTKKDLDEAWAGITKSAQEQGKNTINAFISKFNKSKLDPIQLKIKAIRKSENPVRQLVDLPKADKNVKKPIKRSNTSRK